MTDRQATANLESGSARAADAQVIPFCTLNLRRYYASHYEQDARQFELHKQVSHAERRRRRCSLGRGVRRCPTDRDRPSFHVHGYAHAEAIRAGGH